MNETICVQKYFYVLIFKISSIRRGAALRDGDQGNPNLEGGSIPSRFSVVARLVSGRKFRYTQPIGVQR